jgi:hypothetical protein
MARISQTNQWKYPMHTWKQDNNPNNNNSNKQQPKQARW